MVRLTRIYTRTGDEGSTALGDLSRTDKNDPRVVACGDVDEANAAVGVALSGGSLSRETDTVLRRVSNDLFDVGADLCTPLVQDPEHPPLRVRAAWIEELEADCDRFNEPLPQLNSFVLPTGALGAAQLHVARTVTRRAERSVWAALSEFGDAAAPAGSARGSGGVNPLTARYLNRLSDLLFVLARHENAQAGGDALWVPGGQR
ncbi:cob(I)yrinic acid a,c-diamide adenosyltransferase [Dermacoccaceae bacterium W4C1]